MRILLILFCSFFVISSTAQNPTSALKQSTYQNNDKPKLVVGIVVDQMRYDYLTRFQSKYGEGGFNRLIKEGYNFRNNHINYIPTKTAAGHASIFSGTVPANHGIIANNWFDRDVRNHIYCVKDESYQSVGTASNAGQMSPHRMLTTTFADENRLFTQMRGKTIGISIKDRGSVLPAGHTANASYWFHGQNEGVWITSSFYMNELPKWVNDFNKSDAVERYLGSWNTLYDINTYTESGPDLNTYEEGYDGKETATFPYDLKSLSAVNGGFDILKVTPFGNSMTTDFSIAAIKGEDLGTDEFTDVLTISYSSTDYVGHNFGPNSKEVEDTYIRLDLELERLLKFLDEQVGDDNYTVFLTSDHGAPEAINYLKSNKIPGGFLDLNAMKDEINVRLEEEFRTSNLLLSTINSQLYFNDFKINRANLDKAKILVAVQNQLKDYQLLDKFYTAAQLKINSNYGFTERQLKNGFHAKRSGDILLVMNPSVLKDVPWNRLGTDHGSGNTYDTHIPLIFYGKGIKKGSTSKRTDVIDIAPTMSTLLDISFPNGSTGNVLHYILEDN